MSCVIQYLILKSGKNGSQKRRKRQSISLSAIKSGVAYVKNITESFSGHYLSPWDEDWCFKNVQISRNSPITVDNVLLKCNLGMKMLNTRYWIAYDKMVVERDAMPLGLGIEDYDTIGVVLLSASTLRNEPFISSSTLRNEPIPTYNLSDQSDCIRLLCRNTKKNHDGLCSEINTLVGEDKSGLPVNFQKSENQDTNELWYTEL